MLSKVITDWFFFNVIISRRQFLFTILGICDDIKDDNLQIRRQEACGVKKQTRKCTVASVVRNVTQRQGCICDSIEKKQ
jgi:hypothetical protein